MSAQKRRQRLPPVQRPSCLPRYSCKRRRVKIKVFLLLLLQAGHLKTLAIGQPVWYSCSTSRNGMD